MEMEYKVLDREVLAVAVKGVIDDWAAYIGAVPGKDHEKEYREVARSGTKLPLKIVVVLFPEWNERFDWRITK